VTVSWRSLKLSPVLLPWRSIRNVLSSTADSTLARISSSLSVSFTSAVRLASPIASKACSSADQRPCNTSRRLDAGNRETALQAVDQVKREMAEVVDTERSELTARIGDRGGKIYEVVGGKSMNANATQDD